MFRSSRRIYPLLFLLLLAANLHAQTLSKEKQSQISQSVSDFMAATSVPGVSVAVVLNGQPAWSAGFGMADLENFAPATSSTLFRLASVSKPITATAILQLSERGKLDLDAPIQKYCPAFPKKEWPITTPQPARPPGRHPPLQPRPPGRHPRRQRPPLHLHGRVPHHFR